MIDRNQIHEGMLVRNGEGETMGRVLDCEDEDFIVEKGGILSGGYMVSYGDVKEVSGEEVRLASPHEEDAARRAEGEAEIRPIEGLWRAEDAATYGDEGGGGF